MDEADEAIDNVLMHYGKKGMKWGVITRPVKTGIGGKNRVTERSSATASEDAKRAAEIKRQARKGGTQSLSNQDLQAVINRMNLTSNYAQAAKKHRSRGRQKVDEILSTVGKDLSKAMAKDISQGIMDNGAKIAKVITERNKIPMNVMWGG